MFQGKNDEINQAATQKLMEAITHLRRASDALMAVQPLILDRDRVATFRGRLDVECVWLDHQFQQAAEAHFRG